MKVSLPVGCIPIPGDALSSTTISRDLLELGIILTILSLSSSITQVHKDNRAATDSEYGETTTPDYFWSIK
jgi:hypothetical protein